MPTIKRVQATTAAIALIEELKDQYGSLMFHQSGGCCDGSQPMCYEQGEFRTGGSDVCLGTIEDCEFWMARDQFEYWQYTELTLDVVPGRGSSFSLEIPLGFRFITRSRVFSDEELGMLEEVKYNE
jgi:uncharacterized protein (DUF779 family)